MRLDSYSPAEVSLPLSSSRFTTATIVSYSSAFSPFGMRGQVLLLSGCANLSICWLLFSQLGGGWVCVLAEAVAAHCASMHVMISPFGGVFILASWCGKG